MTVYGFVIATASVAWQEAIHAVPSLRGSPQDDEAIPWIASGLPRAKALAMTKEKWLAMAKEKCLAMTKPPIDLDNLLMI